MSKEIEKVLSLYEEILSNKRSLINEADIAGVDELVYNPVTGSNGDLGYGYDNGMKVQGISWSGHDDHLHLGFTNRDAAMKIIDHADSMGLGTSENPYAKKDPNGQVDPVHTANSLHYKTFDGTPTVGAAVDITGNKDRILEFIKWVESNFANGGVTYAQTPTNNSTDTEKTDASTDTTKVQKAINTVANLVTNLDDLSSVKRLKANPFTEQLQKHKRTINEGSIYGENAYEYFGKIKIPALKGQEIISPINGTIIKDNYFNGCNGVAIENDDDGAIFQYCGIDNPIRIGNEVKANQKIGTTDKEVTITYYDNDWNQINIPSNNTNIPRKKTKKDDDEDDSENLYSGATYTDPIMAAAMLSPVFLYKYLKRKMGGKKKKDDPTLSGSTSNTPSFLESKSDRNQRRIQENITRIKKLL
jgi:hypothetical protein